MSQDAVRIILFTDVHIPLTVGAYDSPVHISEEATNARTAVPFAIISSVIMAGIVGWGENVRYMRWAALTARLGMNMALVFNMGTDLENILSNPIGQPLATVSRCGRSQVVYSHQFP